MKILIGQPKLENNIEQLKDEILRNPDVDIILFPEGYLNQNVEKACMLARTTNKLIITGHKKPKDRAIMISRTGDVILDRAKYDPTYIVEEDGLRMGHLLCDELVLQGMGEADTRDVDFIAHPIGVGMFSDEQFDEWINEAKKIAITHQTMIMGTSHADGSFRGCEVSIPITYCIDKHGEVVFIKKNDVRTVIFNTATRGFKVVI
ncbi:hypothetical protein D3C73_680580 [compost metagenome]